MEASEDRPRLDNVGLRSDFYLFGVDSEGNLFNDKFWVIIVNEK